MKAGVQKKAGYGKERELFQKFKVIIHKFSW